MGVFRLWSYIVKHDYECLEYVDLVQLAAEKPDGIKMLVDFHSWEHFMKHRCQSGLLNRTNNPYIRVYGGEYKTMSDFIISFIEALRAVNIELIFYMDGAKGCSDTAIRLKWNTWLHRQTNDMEKITSTLAILRREAPCNSIDWQDLLRPCLQEVQNVTTLQKLGCEIHIVAGEADTFIAQHMKDDERVVGVFSNDTDFCIFDDTALISDKYFDTDNDLQMDDPSLIVQKPEKLICGLVKSSILRKHFKLSGNAPLCELAIAAGNDYTSPFFKEVMMYKNQLGNFASLTNDLQYYGKVENWPILGDHMKRSRGLTAAVEHSRKFYSLNLPDETSECKDDKMSIILEGVKQGRYATALYAMCKGFYWHRMILENFQESSNTAERSMVYLRSYIYQILLPPSQESAKEYGMVFEQGFQTMTALKFKEQFIPPLQVIIKNSLAKNKLIFHKIMSHQEMTLENCTNYFDMFGTQFGFRCYLLRYFLLLNWKQNLNITTGEFLILCAWVLQYHNSQDYHQTQVLPSPRCITVENWFQCLFRTSYEFIGDLLNLRKEFPSPAEIFSGAVWVCLYTGSVMGPEYQHLTSTFKSLPQVAFGNKAIGEALRDHQHAIKTIVKDLFPFVVYKTYPLIV